MQVGIERFAGDTGEEYRFVRVKANKRRKPSLEVIGANFTNTGVVSKSIINDLTDDERENILKNLLAMISRITDVGFLQKR